MSLCFWGQARGQWVVFDPASHVEQVLNVYNTLESAINTYEDLQEAYRQAERLAERVGDLNLVWSNLPESFREIDALIDGEGRLLYTKEGIAQNIGPLYTDVFGEDTGMIRNNVAILYPGDESLVDYFKKQDRQAVVFQDLFRSMGAHYDLLRGDRDWIEEARRALDGADTYQSIAEAQGVFLSKMAEENHAQRRLLLNLQYLDTERSAYESGSRIEMHRQNQHRMLRIRETNPYLE